MVGMFIDLSKVFDTVVSTTFKKKLELHSTTGNIFNDFKGTYQTEKNL